MLTLQNQPGNEQLIFILILATRSGFACDLTIQLKMYVPLNYSLLRQQSEVIFQIGF